MRALISSSARPSISVTTSVGLDLVAATSTRPSLEASSWPASRAAPTAITSSSRAPVWPLPFMSTPPVMPAAPAAAARTGSSRPGS